MVMFFCSAVGLPTPSVTEVGRSHSDGIKHARVEPGAPSAPTNQGRVKHLRLTCALQSAHAFSKKSEQNTIHKTEFANQARASTCDNSTENKTFRLDAHLCVLLANPRSSTCVNPATKQVLEYVSRPRYTSQRPTRRASQLVHSKLWEKSTNQTRKTWPWRYAHLSASPDAQRHLPMFQNPETRQMN